MKESKEIEELRQLAREIIGKPSFHALTGGGKVKKATKIALFEQKIQYHNFLKVVGKLPMRTRKERGSKMYKVGDKITITQEMVNKLNVKENTYYYDRRLGKTGVCYAQRIDRTHGQMAIDWGEGENEKTNVYWLEDIGLEFEMPEFLELPICFCLEEWLSDRELVIRSLMEQGDDEENANRKVDEISKAMEKYGIVFYRP